jgi:hypothetical protein
MATGFGAGVRDGGYGKLRNKIKRMLSEMIESIAVCASTKSFSITRSITQDNFLGRDKGAVDV